jgi:hypothetical protein
MQGTEFIVELYILPLQDVTWSWVFNGSSC